MLRSLVGSEMCIRDRGSNSSFGVSVGDVDGDGDLDAVFANIAGQPNRVYFNAPAPVPPKVTATNPKANSHDSCVDTDITVTFDTTLNTTTATGNNVVLHTSQTSPSNDTVVTGSGSNITVNPNADLKPGELVSVTVTDGLESDTGGNANPYVFQFRTKVTAGHGYFNSSRNSLGSFFSIGVALGDIDGDGDLDAVFANFGQGNTVYENNGSGNFSSTSNSLGSLNSFGICLLYTSPSPRDS